jgi:hypothetical protein
VTFRYLDYFDARLPRNLALQGIQRKKRAPASQGAVENVRAAGVDGEVIHGP